MEQAKIYAENAIRQKNQAVSYRRMSARVDAVAARVQTAVTTKQVTNSMASVVRAMESTMRSMDLSKVCQELCLQISLLMIFRFPWVFFFCSATIITMNVFPTDFKSDGPIRTAVWEPWCAITSDGGHDGGIVDAVNSSEPSRLAHAGSCRRGWVCSTVTFFHMSYMFYLWHVFSRSLELNMELPSAAQSTVGQHTAQAASAQDQDELSQRLQRLRQMWRVASPNCVRIFSCHYVLVFLECAWTLNEWPWPWVYPRPQWSRFW